MSTWTHVTGTVRLDVWGGVSYGDEKGERKFKKELKELADLLQWSMTQKSYGNLPQHSEGELGVNVQIVENDSSRSQIVISIFGDMRDFHQHDYPILKGWFDRVCDSDYYKHLINGIYPLVRQAVLMIEGSDETKVGNFQVLTRKMSDK